MREVALIAILLGIQDTADKLNTEISLLKKYILSASNDPFFIHIRSRIFKIIEV